MRFIHTSDWHLGKTLNGHKRHEEEVMFCRELTEVVNENDIDIVLICGDIYDNQHPCIESEKLFYETVSHLSNDGDRIVLIIGGSRDNLDRLTLIQSIAQKQGIIVLGDYKITAGKLKDSNFEILECRKNFIKLKAKEEVINIIGISHIKEKDNSALFINEVNRLSEKFSKSEVNILMGHANIKEISNDNSSKCAKISKKDLPSSADYIALGHNHKSQKISNKVNTFYSGSPMKNSKSEVNEDKSVYIVDINQKKKVKVDTFKLTNYKPIEVFNCKNIEEATLVCEENKNRDIWSYFNIRNNEGLNDKLISKMNNTLSGIVEINFNEVVDYLEDEYREKNIKEAFKEFYRFKTGNEVQGSVMNLFLDISKEEGEEDETY